MLEVLFFLAGAAAQPPAQADGPFPIPTVQQEVLGNIRGQPIGPATVADLALPEPFLRRFADRVTLQSFEENFRVVVADEPPDLTPRKEGPPKEGQPTEAASQPAPSTTSADTRSTTWRIAIGVAGLALFVAIFALRRKKA